MSLSLTLFLVGIMGYIFNYLSNISIKTLFTPLSILLFLVLFNVYVNERDETLCTICYVLYTK